MSPLRYRRTSVRTALGITKEEKRIKRELGITALLRPFRWWGNEKRTVKRDLGYYSPEAKFARHELPHAGRKILFVLLMILAIPFALGWFFKSAMEQQPAEKAPATAREPGTLRVSIRRGGLPLGRLPHGSSHVRSRACP